MSKSNADFIQNSGIVYNNASKLNVPDSVSGLQMWVDASDSSTLLLDSSSRIMKWNDKSGNGVFLQQTTDTKRPTISTSTLKNIAGIRFTSTNSTTLASSSNPFAPTITSAAIFIVHKAEASPASTAFSLSGSATAANRWQSHLPYSTGLLYFDVGGNGGSQRLMALNYIATYGDTNILSYEVSTGAYKRVYRNDSQILGNTTTNNITTVDNMYFGSDGGGTTGFADCTFWEILVYNSTISTADRTKIFSYLNQKWGVY